VELLRAALHISTAARAERNGPLRRDVVNRDIACNDGAEAC